MIYDYIWMQVATALDLAEEYTTTNYNVKLLMMRLNELLANQTFVGVATSVSVADFALFFAVSQHMVVILFGLSSSRLLLLLITDM